MALELKPQQKGLVFAASAPLFYALQSVATKFASPAKLEFFLFSRVFFSFLLLAPFFLKYRKKLRSKQLVLHFVRAIFAALSIYCSIYGIRHLALVDAILLESTLPLFIPIIAWMWSRQKITRYSFFVLMLGFSSLFFLLKPKLDILHLASFASIATALTTAITKVSIGKLSKTEHPLAILFYFNLFIGILSFFPCWRTWGGIPSIGFLGPFIVAALFSVLFQYVSIRAYSLMPMHIAGNFAYFSVLFSALFGWLIWNETLSIAQIFGGVVLIGSGLLLIHEKQKDPSVFSN